MFNVLQNNPPTDQRAGVRPISFVLQNGMGFSSPITLKIRPEDLVRTEPSRIAVHQTLGRETQGWADNFGEGLPSCVISGHTGWRTSSANGEDGAMAFELLNQMIAHDYHSLKQMAVDMGADPSSVKLIFVDTLDNFCWNVAPMMFQLRRSRSRPLLFQYNIQLQAISTSIEIPIVEEPALGGITAGLGALGKVIDKIASFADQIKGWVAQALAFKDKLLAPIAATVAKFTAMAKQVFTIVQDTVATVKNGISSVANDLIGIASDIAEVGVGIFRTIQSVASLPGHLMSALGSVAGAFNETLCILRNSLRPRGLFEDFDDLFGASNCSSTTGGRNGSLYFNKNAFQAMQMDRGPVNIGSEAIAGFGAIKRSDPVLAPMPIPELGRHVNSINTGLVVEAGGVMA